MLPSGAGKSAVYKVAGLLLDGPVVVVSPLIALQRDQVQRLEELGEDAPGGRGGQLRRCPRREPAGGAGRRA